MENKRLTIVTGANGTGKTEYLDKICDKSDYNYYIPFSCEFPL